MPAKLDEKAARLIEANNFAFLGTLLPDGSPHVTPMWIDHDGDLVLFNTAMGRVKQKNMARDPRVSIAVADQNNMYDRVVILGRVVSQSFEGAEAHIDKLADKYTGAKKYQRSTPTEKRVIFKIQPVKVM